ncbi:hypothetical protein ACVWYH_006045 [Bradyrhizobium sp. GM24.11]
MQDATSQTGQLRLLERAQDTVSVLKVLDLSGTGVFEQIF